MVSKQKSSILNDMADYKAMKPYMDVADEVKSEYMKKFDE